MRFFADVNMVAEPKPHQTGRKRQNVTKTGNDWWVFIWCIAHLIKLRTSYCRYIKKFCTDICCFWQRVGFLSFASQPTYMLAGRILGNNLTHFTPYCSWSLNRVTGSIHVYYVGLIGHRVTSQLTSRSTGK